jgi:hypothetical protein
MAFASTFEPAYHFRLLYLPGVLYPIMGALRYSAGESWQVESPTDTSPLRTPCSQPVVASRRMKMMTTAVLAFAQVYKRRDVGKRQEIYQPVGVFDHEPNGAEITACFRPPKPPKPAGQWW